MIYKLPYPPSINNYYATYKGRRILSAIARRYRHTVFMEIIAQGFKTLGKERVSIFVNVYPPDNRKRDLDNILKALLDSLVKTGLIVDDSQIDELHVIRMEKIKGGLVEVVINSLNQ